MNSFVTSLLSGGGIAGLLVGIAVAFKTGTEGLVAWVTRRRAGIPRRRASSTMTDAATTNAMLLEALTAAETRSAAKDQRIDQLESEVDQLRTALFEQRRVAEAEVAELRRKVQEVTLQLEALQARLHAGPSNIQQGK